jgi:tripartite-type tricarboxylate transporter receptor subunit TctC
VDYQFAVRIRANREKLKMSGMMTGRLYVALVAGGLAMAASGASASTHDFYTGKTISIYIGSGPAGSYDNFGRLVARHIGRFIPGAPSVVAQNMPGAGSIQAANYIYNRGPKDGTALGLMSPSTTVMQTFHGARYEAAKFRWIGRINSNTNVTFVMSRSPVQNIEQAKKQEVLLGTTAPTSPLSFQTRVINQLVGTKFKLVVGYEDANASLLAAERGEVEGATVAWNTLKTARPEWLAEGKVRVVLQYGMTRHPELPDVPVAGELGPDAPSRQLLSLFMNAAEVGYSLMAAPETPQDRVDTLRSGFSAMLKDSGFKDDAERVERGISPLDGAQLEKFVRETSVISEDMRQSALKAVSLD